MQDTSPQSPTPTQVVEIAVNLDDVTGQALGHAQQALLGAGAVDVWTTPIFMKKQRPGVMLCLLCAADDAQRLADEVLALTGSFGVRMRLWDRRVLERRHESVATRYGQVRLKIGSRAGKAMVARTEYEDVRQLAEAANVPLREVMAAADAAADQWLVSQRGDKP
jgi:uncharacterized protein (DUF111 family)